MRTVLVFWIVLATFACRGAVPCIVDSINTGENMHVSIPEKLLPRLSGSAVCADSTTTIQNSVPGKDISQRPGFRIQVYDDNNPRTARSGAHSTAANVTAAFPELQSYIVFQSPYWRVKVGDFTSRAQAENMLEEIRAAFPGLRAHIRIVRDRINHQDQL